MRRRAALLGLFLPAVVPGIVGNRGTAMSFSRAAVTELTWEGAAGRRPERFAILRVTGVEAEGGGFLGLRRVPGLPGYMPDGHRLTGDVLAGGTAGGGIVLRAPGGMLAGLAPGATVALGLVAADRCICILRVPEGMAPEAAVDWAGTQPCG